MSLKTFTTIELGEYANMIAKTEREKCGKIASHFTKGPDASIYPGIKFANMNRSAQIASHTTAQLIALAIRNHL